jgi:hypothetical protein
MGKKHFFSKETANLAKMLFRFLSLFLIDSNKIDIRQAVGFYRKFFDELF